MLSEIFVIFNKMPKIAYWLITIFFLSCRLQKYKNKSGMIFFFVGYFILNKMSIIARKSIVNEKEKNVLI
jgi:hypothetical protein